MKINLYVDFDGVILNSIDISYKRIHDRYGEFVTTEEASEFYQSIDWNEFIRECMPINDSISHLQEIIDSGRFNVTVLSHVLSSHEAMAKEQFLNECLPGIHFISVMKPRHKWEAVDCRDAILIDDYSENLDLWREHGGIPIKFSLKDKEYDYTSIKSLDEILGMYSSFVKKKTNKI